MYIDWTPLRTLVATILPSSYSHSNCPLHSGETPLWILVATTIPYVMEYIRFALKLFKLNIAAIYVLKFTKDLVAFSYPLYPYTLNDFMYIDWTPLRTLVATILPSSYSHSNSPLHAGETPLWILVATTIPYVMEYIRFRCTKTIQIKQFSFMYWLNSTKDFGCNHWFPW